MTSDRNIHNLYLRKRRNPEDILIYFPPKRAPVETSWLARWVGITIQHCEELKDENPLVLAADWLPEKGPTIYVMSVRKSTSWTRFAIARGIAALVHLGPGKAYREYKDMSDRPLHEKLLFKQTLWYSYNMVMPRWLVHYHASYISKNFNVQQLADLFDVSTELMTHRLKELHYNLSPPRRKPIKKKSGLSSSETSALVGSGLFILLLLICVFMVGLDSL